MKFQKGDKVMNKFIDESKENKALNDDIVFGVFLIALIASTFI